jgi:hypothetical protein
MSLGATVRPPAELIFYLVAREFGQLPWVIADAPLGEVMKTYALMNELQPKQVKGGKRG